MNFTDDELKRFKEDIEKNKTRTGIRFNLHYRTSVIEALLARLEAAESVIAESFDPTGRAYIGYDSWHEALAKWRKVVGK